MRLDELRALGPRSFDRKILDLLVDIQAGRQPIETDPPSPAALLRLAEELDIMTARLARVEARATQLETIIATLYKAAIEDVKETL